jgi:protein O-GlcNAc transferase
MSVVKDWAMLDVKNSDARIELAEMYMQDQKWREAISALESALSIDSTIARAHLLFARACEKTANENGRFSHLKKAYKFSTDNAEILYELGRLYAGRNQLAAARPLLARAVSVDPMHAGAQFEYARVLWTAKDKNGAYEHFSNAAQLDPFNTSYLVQFAQTAFATGKRDVAFDYIKKALSRDSTQFEVLQWAGILYKEAGNTELARTLLLKAVVRSSKCASCYKYLADIYYENGEYDLAVKFYNQSLSIGSYSEAASLGLGNSLIMSGDFEKARQMYEKIFSGNTKGEETLYRLCSVYIRMDMLDKAIILFSQYAGERKSGWIQLAKGEIAEASGQLDDALIAFTVTATLMPENPLAHAGAGRINLVKKENDKAIENFGRALGYAPHNVDLLLGMGKAYEGTGQFQEAFEMYAEVARKAPRQPEVFGLMARVLGQQQQHDQAITVFKRGLELNPKNATLSYGLGRELRDMMQFAEAIKAFKKSVRTRNDEKRFFEAYRNIGDIYYYDLKNPDKAKDFYKKYMKFGGKDEAVATLVNGMKN